MGTLLSLKSEKQLLIVLFLFAFFIRIFFILIQTHYQPFDIQFFAGDSVQYDGIAKSLLNGNGYMLDGVPTAQRAPGYVLFLALLYSVFGSSVLMVGLVQAIISALSVVVLYCIGKELWNKNIGITSAILFAVYPHAVFWSGYVLSETLYVFFVLAFLLVLIEYQKNTSGNMLMVSAIFFAMAVLTRPIMFAFPLFLLVWFLLLHKKKYKITAQHFLIFCMVVLLFFAPWIIRNYFVFDAFIPLTTKGGHDFYAANGPTSNGGSGGYVTSGTDYTPLDLDQGLSEQQQSSIYFKATLGYLRTNPSVIPWLIYRKFWNTWRPNYAGASFKNNLIMIPAYLFVVLFAIYGVWSGWNPGRYALPYLFLLYHLLFHSFVIGMIRFRLPIESVFMLFAAFGLEQLYRKKR